jgi:uncharacterized protein with ParB-like and HNH nuclease domain
MSSNTKETKLLYSVNEIFSDGMFLKSKEKEYFNIPHYQRGYKWAARNVEKLLIDIDNYDMQNDNDKFYCLQNITIVAGVDHFNVIDGQQRLTTLTIILSYLNQNSLVHNKVRFPKNSIREKTNEFLNNIITSTSNDILLYNWDQYITKNPDHDLQDICHIYEVYHSIHNWFESNEQKLMQNFKANFLNKLLHSVKLIINEVDNTTSEEKVFANLNSKRIPLDGSDLVRAILITRVAKEEGKKEMDLKNLVFVNERRVKLGWEMDQINNWWSQFEVKGYFSKFRTLNSEIIGEKKLFDNDRYPINNLYILFAEIQNIPQADLSLDLVEQHNSAISLYKEILKLHNTLQDWYADKEIYHYLGYLFSNHGYQKISFKSIWDLWESSDTRLNFKFKLVSKIKEHFLDNNELVEFTDLTINWYKDKHDLLIKALILLDVINSINSNVANLSFKSFSKNLNDVEHIFPQNPAEIKDKKAYIEFLNKYKESKNRFNLKDYDSKINTDKYLESVNRFIEEFIKKIPINSIGNLVLLYSKLNKSISNSIYSEKRSRIIEYHNAGHFIQPHTFKVFVRDFNDSNKINRDFEFWTEDDIVRTASYINTAISEFFNRNQ